MTNILKISTWYVGFIFCISPIFALGEQLKISNNQLGAKHYDLSACVKQSDDLDEAVSDFKGNKISFSCQGESARDLYFDIGNGRLGKLFVQRMLLGPFNKLSFSDEYADIECATEVTDIVKGVIDRDFKCHIETLASNDFLRLRGTYHNKILNGNLIDHSRYINLRFDMKHAFLLVDHANASEVSFEKRDIPSICTPLKLFDFTKRILEYECYISGFDDAILIYQPRSYQ